MHTAEEMHPRQPAGHAVHTLLREKCAKGQFVWQVLPYRLPVRHAVQLVGIFEQVLQGEVHPTHFCVIASGNSPVGQVCTQLAVPTI